MKRFAFVYCLILGLIGCGHNSAPTPSPDAAPHVHPPVGAPIGGGGVPFVAGSAGVRTADVRSFGAVGNGSTDCAKAFQNAIDSLCPSGDPTQATQNTVPATLYIPSGTWNIQYPVWVDLTYLTIKADPGAVVRSGGAFAPFQISHKRAQNWISSGYHGTGAASPCFGDPQLFTSAHRIDLNGKLDTSITGGNPNHAWGITSRDPASHAPTTTADSYALLYDAAPQTGLNDNWTSTKAFTLELAIENPNGTGIPAGPICGFGFNSPWMLNSDGSQFNLVIVNGSGDPRFQTKTFKFGNASAAGIHQICVQVDLTYARPDGLCQVYASEKIGAGPANQVTVTYPANVGTTETYHLEDWTTNGSQWSITGTDPRTGITTTSSPLTSPPSAAQVKTALEQIYGTGNITVHAVTGWDYDLGSVFNGYTVPLPTINLVSGSFQTGHTPIVDITSLAFTPANALTFGGNYFYPFGIFVNAVEEKQPNTGVASVLNLYGLQFSKGRIYEDMTEAGNGGHTLPFAEKRHTDPLLTQNDAARYTNTNGANTAVYLDTSFAPGNAANTTEKNIAFQICQGALGANARTYGYYMSGPDGPQLNDNFAVVTGQNLVDVSCTNINGTLGGCAASFHGSQIAPIVMRGTFSGGWNVFRVEHGYDYKFIDVQTSSGVNAVYQIDSARVKMSGTLRTDCGMTIIRATSTEIDASGLQLYSSQVNQPTGNGALTPSEALIRIHGGGGFGADYYDFGEVGTDNENAQGPPMIHATKGVNGAIITVRKMRNGGWNQPAFQNNVNVVLDGSSNTPGNYAQFRVEEVDILGSCTELFVDGPGWHCTFPGQIYGSDGQNILLTGAPGTGLWCTRTIETQGAGSSFVPSAGRWIAGTVLVKNVGATAGQVAEWVCSTSGTGGWVTGRGYQGIDLNGGNLKAQSPVAYVSWQGNEFYAAISSTSRQPPYLGITQPSVAPVVNPTGGGTVGGLLTGGTYKLRYTFVNGTGESNSSSSVSFAIASGNIPQVTLPSLPAGVTSINIYLSNNNGGAGSEMLYATGVTTTTFNLTTADLSAGQANLCPDVVWTYVGTASVPVFKALTTVAP